MKNYLENGDRNWKKWYNAQAVCYDDDCHSDVGSSIMMALCEEFRCASYYDMMPYCPFCGKKMETYIPPEGYEYIEGEGWLKEGDDDED